MNGLTLTQLMPKLRQYATDDSNDPDMPRLKWDGKIFLSTPDLEETADMIAETHLGKVLLSGDLLDGRHFIAAYECNYSPVPVHVVVWP